MPDPIKLNLCSGGADREGFINVDLNPAVRPTVVLDITKEKWPWEDSTVDEIWLMHGLEHIERYYWDYVMMQAKRILKDNGKFILGYPEFSVCVMNYLNERTNEYWLKTIFGRRLWPGDYHVTAVNSDELKEILESTGFYRVRYSKESEEVNYNSIMVAFKDPQPQCRELLLASELGLGDGVSIKEVA